MRVLLLCQDLYRSVGGGETVYRKIISATPSVDFFYFRVDEAVNSSRPPNAHAITLLPHNERFKVVWPALGSVKLKQELANAMRYAYSVAGREFDIVEYPDYQVIGSMIRHAFGYYGVKAKRYVLSMHGTISTSIDLNWDSSGNTADIREAEKKQFIESDAVYSISRFYMDEWNRVESRPIHYLDPLHFINRPAPFRSLLETGPSSSALPSLYCVGRLERRKGNDIFTDLSRWIDRSLYSGARQVGGNQTIRGNRLATDILYTIATHRNVNLNYLGQYSPAQLVEVYRGRNMVILPVRYDSFNLVALEALFNGCPVAISNRAGVCGYLDATFPGIPYVKIDFDHLYASVPRIEETLAGYDEHRGKLIHAINDLANQTPPPLAMADFYRKVAVSPPGGRMLGEMREVKLKPVVSIKRRIFRHAAGLLGEGKIADAARAGLRTYQHGRVALTKSAAAGRDFLLANGATKAAAEKYRGYQKRTALFRNITRLNKQQEGSPAELKGKLQELYSQCGTPPLWRCTFWQDIARLERMRGRALFSTVYELRLMRLLGWDAAGELDYTVKVLAETGFKNEAEVVRRLYGGVDNPADLVYDYLVERRERHLAKPDLPWETLHDFRLKSTPKVSVIVSLYNAADKLGFFLTALQLQTLYKRGEVEIILVDSGSPANEFAALLAAEKKGVSLRNIYYARSEKRETIQSAWNRGIKLARADYLCFLGVDEGLFPDALERLYRELANSPETDWCMAGSVVTEVNSRGGFERDVMLYDRRGATLDLAYLESCYLGHVGALYRKNIHERFGYYDETFRGAGDTEFKMRIMPGLKVRFIPETLGVFFNYPEERTTNTPAVEIEDSRAWYAHRSRGGIRYAFADNPVAAEELLKKSLGYRKSYCGHISSDISYAYELATFLVEEKANPLAGRLLPDLEFMQSRLRDYNYLRYEEETERNFRRGHKATNAIFSDFRRMEAKHRKLLAGDKANPAYRVFNDNQFEQHSWLWI